MHFAAQLAMICIRLLAAMIAVCVVLAIAGATQMRAGEPRKPDSERASFRLSDPELEIELVAAEPDVVSPVAMAWDARGRLYVAEMIGYPASEHQCRIALLEDRDGDGHYQRVATFADGLSFVTSVMPYRGGLLATAAPDLVYLEDTDSDGRADVRRVEWTGFGTGSQQLRANALHWGIDNWIYGANGRCDGEVRRPDMPADRAVSLRTRDFRWHPATGVFQAIVGQSQFGQSHDDWGNRFLSWNTIPIRHVVLEDRYLAASPQRAGEVVFDIAEPGDTGRVYPLSPPPRQFNSEQANYYNAMCGLAIYRGDLLGESYAGNAFVCESLTNLVTRRVLEPSGATFVARRGPRESDREFLASSDNWFHPVSLPTGPDGALYVVDFYREFVEHPIYVANLEARAATDWRHGASHGRLWRIKRRGSANAGPRVPRSLDKLASAQLVALLEHPVGWWRDTAQRLLVEGADRSAEEPLVTLARDSQSPLARAHALWTLEGLNALADDCLLRALADSHAGVRRHAIRLTEPRLARSEALAAAAIQLATDRDTGVRLQLALALGTWDSPAARDTLAQLLGKAEDRWITLAATGSASHDPWKLVQRLSSRGSWIDDPTLEQAQLLEQLGGQIGASGDEAPIVDCTAWLASQKPAPGVIAVLAGLAETSDARRRRTLVEAEGIRQIVQACTEVASQTNANQARRIQAINVVARCDASPAARLMQWLRAAGTQPVHGAIARGLARLNDPVASREVYASWRELGVAARQEVLAASLRSHAAAEALLAALDDKTLLVGELPPAVRLGLAELRDEALKARAASILAESPLADRQAVVARYRSVPGMTGDLRRGATLFKEHCITCHAMQGIGGRVGPDLSGVGSRRNDLLLVDILDPSRNVTPDFVSYVVATTEGQVYSGLIVSESADSVTLRRAGGEQDTIARRTIEELRSSGKSLMPDGLEEKLAPEQLADVLEFLRRGDRTLLEQSPPAR